MNVQKFLFFVVLVSLLCLVIRRRREDYQKSRTPKIVHLIYFPWNRDQTLKSDPHDFDHSFYESFKNENPDYEVKLWTLPETRDFVEKNYPRLWPVIASLPRPVMMVDILRWLVVYHYGGIYWQYDSKALVPLDNLLPSSGKEIKLHTEAVLTPEFSRKMAEEEPIRRGEPEELTRVYSCMFAAHPKSPYVAKTLKTLLSNVQKYKIERDYDILYVTGNAAISTIYNRYGKNNPRVELVPLEESQRIFEAKSRGTWRKVPINEHGVF